MSGPAWLASFRSIPANDLPGVPDEAAAAAALFIAAADEVPVADTLPCCPAGAGLEPVLLLPTFVV